jgi:hypothetical protein
MKKFRAIVLEADKPNKNNRIYPKELLERVITENQETVKGRAMMGQIGFPGDSIIRIANVSHVVTDLAFTDGAMVAEIEVLNTPAGLSLQAMMDSGVEIALRPQGIGGGDVDDNGNFVLDDSYKLISICVVKKEEAA